MPKVADSEISPWLRATPAHHLQEETAQTDWPIVPFLLALSHHFISYTQPH